MNILMKAAFLVTTLGLFPFGAFAQTPKLPAGYHIQMNASGQPNIVRYDFDGDGANDVVCAIEKGEEEDVKLMATLRNGKIVLSSKSTSTCCGSMSQKSGVIDVHSKGMRGFSYYKFRWDKPAMDFRLIGYETESFGNAAHDGSGTSSLNLINGDFIAEYNSWNEKKQDLVTLPKVKRKIPVSKKMYLKNFGDDMDEGLATMTHKYLPKAVQ